MYEDWPTLPYANKPEPPAALPPSQRRSGPLVPPSTTAQLRARQRIESTQSALSELNVLNEQLIALPERLEERGIARKHRAQLHDAMESYTTLAAKAWDGLAADRLDQVAGAADYRQLVVATSRRISRLQQEAAMPLMTDEEIFRAPSPGFLWQTHTAEYRQALVAWRDGLRLGASPDLAALGSALESLRTAVGLTGLSAFSVVLHRIMLIGNLIFIGLLGMVAIAAAASATTLQLAAAARLMVLAATALSWFCYVLWISTSRGRNLWRTVGAVRWRLSMHHGAAGQRALSIWRWVTSGLVLAALGTGLMLLALGPPGKALGSIHDVRSAVLALAGPAMPAIIGLLGLALATPVLIYLPVTLVHQFGLARDLTTTPAREPVGRAATLPAALYLTAWHGALVLTAALLVAQAQHPAVWLTYDGLRLSAITPVALVALVAVYLAAVEWPFRLGIERWRQARLAALNEQKRELTARLDRMDGAPVVADDTSAVQYDVARLQYAQLQEREVRQVPASPYRARSMVAALLIITLVALAIDNALVWIPR